MMIRIPLERYELHKQAGMQNERRAVRFELTRGNPIRFRGERLKPLGQADFLEIRCSAIAHSRHWGTLGIYASDS